MNFFSMLDKIKNIRISKFDYPLPDDKIARHPLSQRDACRLLKLDNDDRISHHLFSEIVDIIPHDSILVCNDTRVINARIKFRKDTGSVIEVFLLEPISPRDYVLMFQAKGSCSWSCMVGNLKRWKDKPLTKTLLVDGKEILLTASRGERLPGNAHQVHFEWDDKSVTFASVVEAAGFIPIPPYLKRESETTDKDDYQTIYAKMQGSVAAPTAGLHFTPALFDELRSGGVDIVPVTLHVGAGTFQPVKSEEIGQHPMHTEVFSVTLDAICSIRDALAHNRPITAVGTTSVRTLESLPVLGLQLSEGDKSLNVGQWEAYNVAGIDNMSASEWKSSTIDALDALISFLNENSLKVLTVSTSIMIAPGFRWRIVDNMITNFHQPQSTLLLLVSSFLGADSQTDADTARWRKVYNEALEKNYRFLSYGDACFFSRPR